MMNFFKRNLNIAIIPILVMVWGILMILFFDPFYSKSSDPEYPYLINGLNCALLNFNRIGLIEHPGTPFQLFCGLSILITYLFTGEGGIALDVLSRPDYYVNAISISLLIVQVTLVFLIGTLSLKKKISFWQIAILQASCLLNDVLIGLLYRVNVDRFFVIIVLVFILIYLKYGFKNRLSMKFAVFSGIIMAMGLASKFNFLPLLFLPLFLIESNKNRLVYIGTGIVSFFVFISPIIDKFIYYKRFLTGIFKHDELYGSGSSKVLNLSKMTDHIQEIFKINPELFVLILLLLVLVVIVYRNRDKKEFSGFSLLFIGFLVVIFFQILMVSKHFKNYYLTPIFMIYGFIFFSISHFLPTILKNKKLLMPLGILLPILFFTFSVSRVYADVDIIMKMKDQRDKIRNYVDSNISKDDFWFVEPTWESGPHIENAIVYGLSYCGHRSDYLPQLMKVNPNIITYEGNTSQVKLWRSAPVSLDSVLLTGKNIYIYSTPGRNASILVQMIDDAATRNEVKLSDSIVYSDSETQNQIIRLKAFESSSNWETYHSLTNSRQSKIEGYIIAIKNSPVWLSQVNEKAKVKKLPLDSMILLDAIWMADHE